MADACDHVSRTAMGCRLCTLAELVCQRGAVGNGVDETWTSCPYCGLLVCAQGDPPTIFHALPECAKYRAESVEAYTEKLRAKIRGAGRD